MGSRVDFLPASGRSFRTALGATVFVLLVLPPSACGSDAGTPSSLHRASAKGDLAGISNALREGMRPDRKGSYGRRPLHEAAEAGHEESVRLLLESGANVGDLDNAGRTALHLAAGQGKTGCVRILVRAGAPLDLLDSSGFTPFGTAVLAGKEAAALLLLAEGADPGLHGREQDSPARTAKRWGHLRLLQAIEKAGTNR